MTRVHEGARIALVQAGLGAGGTEKVLARLARHLDGQGYRVTILAIWGMPDAAYYPVPESVEIRTMVAEKGARAALRTFARIRWLRAALRGQEVVLSCLTKINVQVALATAGLGLRRIASERNNFLVQRMNPIWRYAMPMALATADRAVMQTEAARAALPAFARGRAVVIPNAVEVPERQPDLPGPAIVAVGRLAEQKGFDTLIGAVSEAAKRGSDMHVTIYGAGEDREALFALSERLGVARLIDLAGPSPTPHAWTRAPGIFVLSSRFEGFPNVLVEAMAAGFAVIATDCDWGPREILRHGREGVLIPVGDIDALADALIRLHDDADLRERLGRAARLRATAFAEERILSAWERVILGVPGSLGPAEPRPTPG
ncbi:Glycosyltransferase involved in cell wall bisynthesis [Palleronia marisminoris]|uniref:N-acetylgalactosamine-N, N'-diacetylbacillosaminyl-diphospho-undecaprenol 4-alpha-N-acetylgalactosaminyltransferase n=1 Tax=Palleronia marisminoris TaxID=315423 RepID=A0A1Y5SCD5_9RHOB|nr:glycosyltransferase family 4 protein [Palleronia marisminoris]SFG67998.1 Glycosyltransferase involved in cell wall bisynthesis [Palleronia marisminoris]SLN34728.1 N-acetylgalactosamine-N, N'-diacetylbacillosaminyl-diphospho-undecaprenol 4-alpha-N-acetylgalactosaminyltransferase [Palleronia marisminoris]